jgi:hypothetical protein
MRTRQFRPIVATNRPGLPALGHDRIQHSGYSGVGEARVHFQSQILPHTRIHHVQHPDRPPALHRIVHKVQRPLLVRRGPSPQRCPTRAQCLRFFCRIVNPASRSTMHALVIRVFSTASQPHLQLPIPEARLLPRQLHQPRAERFIGALRLVAVTRYRHRHQTARPPLTEGILLLHLLDSRLPGYELQPFFLFPQRNQANRADPGRRSPHPQGLKPHRTQGLAITTDRSTKLLLVTTPYRSL